MDCGCCPLPGVHAWSIVTPAHAAVRIDSVIGGCAVAPVNPAHAGVQIDSAIGGDAIAPVTPAHAGVQVRWRLDSGFRRNDGLGRAASRVCAAFN